MVVVRRPEIRVAREIVGEEANADRERNQASGERKSVELGGVEEFCVLQIALYERLEILLARENLIEILFVFGGGGGRRADHITEVVERGSGHDGIKIDYSNALLGYFVKHDVVDLRIVVGDTLGNFSARHGIDDTSGLLASGVDEVHLALYELESVFDVGRRGFIKKLETVDRIVELGQNLIETRLGEIGERVLELRESVSRKESLIGVFNQVDRARTGDERIKTPRVLISENLKRLSALRADMGGDAADVLHHAVSIGKDVGIDALENVRDAADIIGLEGIVDVAGTIACDLHNVGHSERGKN